MIFKHKDFKNNNSSVNNNYANLVILGILVLFVIIVSITNVSAVGTMIDCSSDPSIVACYHFNNDSSVGENDTFVYDWSNYHGNNGTIINSTFNSTGGFLSDGDYNFDGINSLLTILQINPLLISQGITIQFWVKMKNSSSRDILSKWNKVNNYSFSLNTINTNQIRLMISKNGSNLNTTTLSGNTPLQNNEWYFVTGRWNGTSLNVYINGVKDTTASTVSPLYDGTSDFIIGNSPVSGNKFNGTLDELIIYNRSLNDNEIILNYQTYVPKICYNVTDDLTISDSLTPNYLCNNNYNINDSNANGIITINTNNVILDCNSSLIYGNYTYSNDITSIGIKVNNNLNNITIRNCRFNYLRFPTYLTNDYNITLQNITTYYYRFNYMKNVSYTKLINSNLSANNFSAIYVEGNGNCDYNNFSYNDIGPSYYGSIIIKASCDTNYNFIGNNIFRKASAEFYSVKNLTFFNNSILNSVRYAIYSLAGDGNKFLNNYLYNSWYGITLDSGEKNYNLSYNNIYNTALYGIYGFKTSNGFFFNNTINFVDQGIVLLGNQNFTIYKNTFYNTTSGADGYNDGISLYSSASYTPIENVLILNNTFSYIGSRGVYISKAKNVQIINNSFSMYNITEKRTISGYNTANNQLESGYGGIDEENIPCAIEPVQLVSGWTSDGTETINDNLTNKIFQYNSSNIYIKGNSFSTTTQCYLNAQGTINLTQDLSNFWYRSYQFPNYLTYRDEYWMNPSYNNMTNKYNRNTISNIINQGYRNKFYTQLTITKDYLWFKNNNNTNNYGGISLFNLSDNIVYHNNQLIRTNSTEMQLNFTIDPYKELYVYNETTFNTTKSFTNALIFNSTYGLYNTSLHNGYFNWESLMGPDNLTYVLENYNYTENVLRTYDPINLTSKSVSSSGITWTISSKLRSNVKVPLILTVPDGFEPKTTTVTIEPKDGVSYSTTYTFDSSTNLLTINLVDLNYSTTSNKVYLPIIQEAITDTCSKSAGIFLTYVSFLGLIGVLAFLGLALSYLVGLIDKKQLKDYSLIGVITTLISVGVLLIVGIILVSSICTLF